MVVEDDVVVGRAAVVRGCKEEREVEERRSCVLVIRYYSKLKVRERVGQEDVRVEGKWQAATPRILTVGSSIDFVVAPQNR